MPIYEQCDLDLGKLASVLEQLPAAVTIFGLDGAMLYYNETAPDFLNRKPEFLGKDIRRCHKKDSTNERVNAMIDGFKAGGREPVRYISAPYGKPIRVTVAPYILDGKLLGCIQHVVMKDTE